MAGLDTSFLIDLVVGRPEAIALYKEQKEPLFVSELVVFEFLCGNISPRVEDDFFAAVSECTFVTIEREEVLLAARIFRELKRRGETRPLLDTAIAASYLANNISTIITGNAKDFEGIPGLKIESY